MKKLTERQAWLVLAKACEAGHEHGFASNLVFDGSRTRLGLCNGVDELVTRTLIATKTEAKMRARIALQRPGSGASLYFENMTDRAVFCRKQAALLTKKRKKVDNDSARSKKLPASVQPATRQRSRRRALARR